MSGAFAFASRSPRKLAAPSETSSTLIRVALSESKRSLPSLAPDSTRKRESEPGEIEIGFDGPEVEVQIERRVPRELELQMAGV